MRRSITAVIGAVVLTGSAAAIAAPTHMSMRGISRPASEHVPRTVGHVRIAYRDSADASNNSTFDLHGAKAAHIIDLFNALKREPRDAVHCLAMGTAHTEVRFLGANHKWVASQAICTNVTVTRDGNGLPTLIPTKAWNRAITHYLGHSPTGTG